MKPLFYQANTNTVEILSDRDERAISDHIAEARALRNQVIHAYIAKLGEAVKAKVEQASTLFLSTKAS